MGSNGDLLRDDSAGEGETRGVSPACRSNDESFRFYRDNLPFLFARRGDARPEADDECAEVTRFLSNEVDGGDTQDCSGGGK